MLFTSLPVYIYNRNTIIFGNKDYIIFILYKFPSSSITTTYQ